MRYYWSNFSGCDPVRHLRGLRLAGRAPLRHLARARLDVAGSNAARRSAGRRSQIGHWKAELGGGPEHLPEVRAAGGHQEVEDDRIDDEPNKISAFQNESGKPALLLNSSSDYPLIFIFFVMHSWLK